MYDLVEGKYFSSFKFVDVVDIDKIIKNIILT